MHLTQIFTEKIYTISLPFSSFFSHAWAVLRDKENCATPQLILRLHELL